MSIRKLSVSAIPLTREVAQEFRDMEPLPGERRIKEKRLKAIGDWVQKGQFVGADFAIVTMKGSSDRWRANGQHTATVIAELPEDLYESQIASQGITATITNYEVDSKEEFPDVFELFDNPASLRNNEDAILRFTARYADLNGMEPRFLINIADGVDLARRPSKLTGKPKKQKDQINLGEPETEPILHGRREQGMYFSESEVREFAVWAHPWYHTGKWTAGKKLPKNSWLFRYSVLTAKMFETWKSDREITFEWWDDVFYDRGTNEDPTRLFIGELNALRKRQGRRSSDYVKAFTKFWKQYLAIKKAEKAQRAAEEKLKQQEEGKSSKFFPPPITSPQSGARL